MEFNLSRQLLNLFNDDYFVYPDQSKHPFFKMKKADCEGIIIQHPIWSNFDPDNNQIYREEFVLKVPSADFWFMFILGSIINSNLKKDEIMWSGTGYWTVEDNNFQYIGMGIPSLLDTIVEIETCNIVMCLTSRDFAIFLKAKYIDSEIQPNAIIDIYANNEFLPFVEVLVPFRKTIEELSEYTIRSKEKFKYSSIELVTLNPPFNETAALTEVLIPHAISPIASRSFGPLVLKNNFKGFSHDIFNELPFLFAYIPGGINREDLFRDGKYSYSYKLTKFDDVIFLYGFLRWWENDGDLIEHKEFDIEYFLDYFTGL